MNLVKLALAAERFAQTQPPITVEAARCVRARDKSADCDLCARLCPANAIQLEGGVHVDAEACIRCGLCLHVCPTGTLSGSDGVHHLLYCASQVVDHERLELACAMHPDPAPGDAKTDAVITTTGCLAALGASAYLSLAARGVTHTRVRLDACAQCPLALLRPEIEAVVHQANDLLAGLGKPQTVSVAEPPAKLKRRPVYSAKNPPLSRRGFFQAVAQRGRDLLPSLRGESERHRLIEAVQQLAPDNLDQPIPNGGFSALAVSDACSACETCARVCPTSALEIRKSDDYFELAFSPADCIACGLCVKFCDPGALQTAGAPSLADLVGQDKLILHSGALQRCRKCNALFAGPADEGLCPHCAFRRRNPFGSGMSSLKNARRPPQNTAS